MTNRAKLVSFLFLMVLLLITGTFAWTSFSQRALNENSAETSAGGRIHDDYSKISGNKDIYAENFGETNVLVRIKLSEYFELNGQSVVNGTVKTDKNTWIPFLLPGTTNPGDLSNKYREYVTWTLGGDKVYLPTFNKNSSNKEVDATGNAIDCMTLGQTAVGNGEHEYFTEGDKVINPETPTSSHVATNTIVESRQPVGIDFWLSLSESEKIGDYWVIDKDGWAYWANTLKPSTSTSLLLNQLHYIDETTRGWDYYYAIDVLGEFTDLADREKFKLSEYGAPSESGQLLIDTISTN